MDDPYIAADCRTYIKHGACVCSTGYPATCTARGAESAIAISGEQGTAESDQVGPEL